MSEPTIDNFDDLLQKLHEGDNQPNIDKNKQNKKICKKCTNSKLYNEQNYIICKNCGTVFSTVILLREPIVLTEVEKFLFKDNLTKF